MVINLEGRLHAFSNYCTHIRHSFWVPSAGAVMSGNEIVCWVHGSTYDMRSGECIWGPGYDPLPLYGVEVEGDDVYLTREPVANFPID
jgi:3-phenylpropionate/trans-cinnamate dioxygenase ferredoxin subunit